MSSDPLAPLLELPGVAAAVQQTRDAVAQAHAHPANRRGWPASAAEASV
ncbi:MAG: oxidoreductase, partial [Actinomycetota bacterium]|nr:oxidoreductase [Actinomycetota bacterium]